MNVVNLMNVVGGVVVCFVMVVRYANANVLPHQL
jgi:hypothetical protein